MIKGSIHDLYLENLKLDNLRSGLFYPDYIDNLFHS